MEPPLILAIRTGDSEKVGTVLNEVNVNEANADGNTPLLIACALGNSVIVNMLIKKGPNLNAITSTGFTPLMIATVNQFKEIVEILCAAGASVNATTNKDTGLTALMLASGRYSSDNVPANPQIVETLIHNGADVNIQATKGYTALMDASIANNPEIVEMLLQNGADPSLKTEDNQTAYSLIYNPNGHNPAWIEMIRPPAGGSRGRRKTRRSRQSRQSRQSGGRRTRYRKHRSRQTRRRG